jgi:hypothetical protein
VPLWGKSPLPCNPLWSHHSSVNVSPYVRQSALLNTAQTVIHNLCCPVL